jgi:Mannose-6-phosphate isomerase
VIELDAGWSDVGAWDAVWELEDRDQDGNALRGETITIDASNNLIHADKLTIAAVGVEDLVIIESDDAILVARRDEAQKVKQVVKQLDATGSTKHQLHRKVFRPWGAYDSIDQGERFQVKRITVKPGGKLSLQMHHHRAEHWIVVTGTAKVTCGEDTFLLTENQSTYIPLGQVHRLENPGSVPLELIEVQSGSYLGEDDIVRFEDTYGRS